MVTTMQKTDLQWDLILQCADELGVSKYSRIKWKQRQMVPHRWRWDIIRMTKGAVNWDYFEQMDEQARNAA